MCLLLLAVVPRSIRRAAKCSPLRDKVPKSHPFSVHLRKELPKKYTLSTERAAEAEAYARARHELYLLRLRLQHHRAAASIASLCASRQVFRDWGVQRLHGNRFWQACRLRAVVSFHSRCPRPPERSDRAIGSARRYAQSIQGWSSWLWDEAKGELLALALAVILVWLLFYAVIRAAARAAGGFIFAWPCFPFLCLRRFHRAHGCGASPSSTSRRSPLLILNSPPNSNA